MRPRTLREAVEQLAAICEGVEAGDVVDDAAHEELLAILQRLFASLEVQRGEEPVDGLGASEACLTLLEVVVAGLHREALGGVAHLRHELLHLEVTNGALQRRRTEIVVLARHRPARVGARRRGGGHAGDGASGG